MALNTPRAKSKIPCIPGTKPSIQNAQLLISTGIPSLDFMIGGGLPIGSIMLIEEDAYGNYARVMLKYFMAEGVVSSHPLFVASRDSRPAQLISEMPAPVSATLATSDSRVMDSQMQIAWRYQNMRIVESSPTGSQAFGHFYDLTKQMDKEIIDDAEITQWDGENGKWQADGFENSAYVDLLKNIQQTMKSGDFLVSANPEKRNILRIALHSIGSRLWLSDTEEATHNDLLRFLYCFRAIMRSAYAVATITVPTLNFDNSDALVQRLEHLSDTAIALESFMGSSKETNPVFKDYHGLLHIKKLAAINTLAPHCPESFDLAFKMRRKKFLIKILHLPPEFDDSAQREQDDSVPSGIGCSSGTGRLSLDF
ncbi:putative elongator complex protein 4 [Venturia canescens]|uniref:putative elongator complex protein 4 n=1 Tax=Venturia canescens TaxID=32260 RepID=UPI001C9D46D0|nr:putative elongator complex protein 4 [Venturia canescens]XP_043267119.1 putative elongator complex protein 4 [Venturia canescens]